MDFDDLKLENLSEEELVDLLTSLSELEEYQKYNKIEYFIPYQYQIDFMNKSSSFKQRMMRSGNQTGKSYGASFEVAQHLTGRYQPWYTGERIEGSGHLYWCIGIDIDSTARVMQKALLGTSDIRQEELIGTGSIPLECICMDNIVKDGSAVKSILIRHKDGGYNTLQFFGAAQGQDRLMGAVVKFAWMDEEPRHNSMEIYSQCLTRTTTTNGHVMVTCTPEAGLTPLQQLFEEGRGGDELYVASASWDDCPHITAEDIKRLLAGVPEYQRDMRRHGLPVLGTGAVLPFTDESIVCEDITPLPHWPVIVGLDFSSVNDASVLQFACYDPDKEVYYLYKEIYISNIEQKNPEYMAKCITTSDTPTIPCVSPHDGGLNSASPNSKAKVMKSKGANVMSEPFYNGYPLMLSYKDAKSIAREPGLEFIRQLQRDGKFKVCRSVSNFLREKRSLFYVPKNGGGISTKGADDAIDAARYAIISLVNNRGIPYGQCVGVSKDWNNGFDQLDEGGKPWWHQEEEDNYYDY